MSTLPKPLREDATHMHVLTGIRGWAALWVFLYHAWIFSDHPDLIVRLGANEFVLTPLVSLGGAGVSIFFVLSGFLLSLPFAKWQAGLRERPETTHYLFRRVMRVFPAYYAQLLILSLLAAWLPSQPGIDGWHDWGRHLLMLFTPPPLGVTPINPVWWTLPIEFSFYLALPFLVFLLRFERGWLILPLALFCMWAWRHAVTIWMADSSIQERVVASYQLPGSLDTFSMGMLAALLYVNRARLPRWLWSPALANWLAVSGLLLMLVAVYWLFYSRGQYWSDYPIFYGWTPALALGTAAIIFAGANGGRLARALFGNPFMVFTGTISYSLYLWHHPILDWLHAVPVLQGLGVYRLPVMVLVALPLTMAISAASYAWIERPLMNIGRRQS